MEHNNSVLNKNHICNRLITEAILNDNLLNALYAERVKIYSVITPKVILKDNGEIETVCVDETNHPGLSKINQLIEHRTEQINQSLQ